MLVVAVVIFIFYVGFKMFAKRKLLKEQKNTDVSKFKPRKMGTTI